MLARRNTINFLTKEWTTPPGRKFWPIGHVPQFIKDANEFNKSPAKTIQNWFNKYGETLHVNLGLTPMLWTKDIDLVKFMTTNDPERWSKGTTDNVFRKTFENSILFTEGDQWKRKRNLMRNAFKKNALENFIPAIHKASQEMVALWKKQSSENKTIDANENFVRLTMDVIGRVGFGYDFEAQEKPGQNQSASDFSKVLEVNDMWHSQLAWQFLGVDFFKQYHPEGKKYAAGIERLKTIVQGVLKNRVNAPNLEKSKKTDLLGYLLESSSDQQVEEYKGEEDNKESSSDSKESSDKKISKSSEDKFSNKELINEVLLFFLAGHETTATLLSWALYYIAKHPHVRQKLLEELQSVEAPGNNDETVPSWSVVNHLPYMTQVLKETLRLRGAAPAFARETIYEEKFKGKTIPAQTVIIAHVYSLHRDPKYYKNPEEFDPDHFSPENVKERDTLAWAPFAVGPRNCIGMQFAMIEARTVLAYILPRFDFTSVSEPTVIEKTLHRPDKILMKLKPL